MAVLSNRDQTAPTRRRNEVALLDAVVTLVDEGSAYADLNIQQIVDRAGLSRPTFYSYFKDKREVALTLGRRLADDLLATAAPWLAGEDDRTARETLRDLLYVFAEHRGTVAMITEAATYDAAVADFWRDLHDRFIPRATGRVRAGHPHLDEAAARARAFLLVWMTERTLTEHLATPTVDEEALLEQLAWTWNAAVGAV